MFVSVSIDDVAIQEHLGIVKGGRVVGYHDVGPEVGVDLGGGEARTPATHAMTIMVTTLNDMVKAPCAYFLIPKKFSGEGKEFVKTISVLPQTNL